MDKTCTLDPYLAIEVIDINLDCPASFVKGDTFSVNDLIPQGLCPTLFHAVIPYIEAIQNNCLFNRAKDDFIMVQCPHPDFGITVKISKKDDLPIIECVQAKSVCPHYDLSIGRTWVIHKEKPKTCRKAFYCLYPFLNGMTETVAENNANHSTFTGTCSRYPNFVSFNIKKHDKKNTSH